MVVVHSGKRKIWVDVWVCVCARVCMPFQHAEVYEFLCLLSDFVDFFNFVFVSSEIVIVVNVRNMVEI
jgi:hypothetical protein